MAGKKKDKIKLMRQLRAQKAKPHLQQYAPVWLVDDNPVADDELVFFNVVFNHPRYGWVNRRYRFDAFDNVLYHSGQTTITEEKALEVEEQTPYVPAELINSVSSYGG